MIRARTRTFVRMIPADFVAAQAVATLAARRHARRVWVIADDFLDGSFRRLVPRRLAALGVRVVGRSSFEGRKQIPRTIRALRRHRPDAVVYTGFTGGSVSRLWNRVHRAAPKLRLYGAWLDEPHLARDLSRGARARTIFVRPEIPLEGLSSKAKAVAARFQTAYGHAPGFYALTAYESMAVLLDAIDRAGPTAGRDGVRDALFATRDRASILGTYSVTATGDTTLGRHATTRSPRTTGRSSQGRLRHCADRQPQRRFHQAAGADPGGRRPPFMPPSTAPARERPSGPLALSSSAVRSQGTRCVQPSDSRSAGNYAVVILLAGGPWGEQEKMQGAQSPSATATPSLPVPRTCLEATPSHVLPAPTPLPARLLPHPRWALADQRRRRLQRLPRADTRQPAR